MDKVAFFGYFEGRTGLSPEHVKIVKYYVSGRTAAESMETGTGTKGQAWFTWWIFWRVREKRTYFAVYLEDTDNREQVSSKKAKRGLH